MDGQHLLNVYYTKITRMARTHNFLLWGGWRLILRLCIICANFKNLLQNHVINVT